MKILIIGGAGYLGLPLSKKFAKHENGLICVDKLNYTNRKLIDDSIEFKLAKYFKFIEDDILNIEDYVGSFNGIDRFVYLASPRLLELDEKDTITSEINRLKFVINKIKKEVENDFTFFFSSSCSVYGRQPDYDKLFNEDSPTHITTRYSELKIKSENLIKQEDPEKFKIFRLSTLYGNSNPMRNDVLINNLIYDIKNKKDLEIFDPNAKRPHLHVNNTVEILHHLISNSFDGQILNIGYNEFNQTKKEIIERIKKTVNFNFPITYVDSNDSRDYAVDFSKLEEYEKRWFQNQRISYDKGIYDLWIDKINISVEDFDSILNAPRPPMCSKTWYLAEEGKMSFPKVFGEWNIYNEKTKKLFGQEIFQETIVPIHDKRYVNIVDRETSLGKFHIYLVPIYNPDFFESNIKIGYKCVSKKYLNDVRTNKAKIVFYFPLEGYSGGDGNRDLEIISQWNQDSNIPDKNVYYLSGNLRIKNRLYAKNLKYNGIPVSAFDLWLTPHHMPSHICPFNPHEKNLYLSYNRNMGGRRHRIILCTKLLENDLLRHGKISVGTFKKEDIDIQNYPYATELSKILPIEIDKTLEYNLANDVSHDDYHGTFVSLVTETLHEPGTLFISEKTWKPIYMGHPFIILGNPGTIAYLKQQGFKTFDRWWSEEYDGLNDLNHRIDAIVSIIKEYSRKNLHELKQIRTEMNNICEFNQKHFRKMVKDKYHVHFDEYNPQREVIKILSNIQYEQKNSDLI